MADQTQMGQLFQNLIENAIKFRGEGPPCVHVSAREEGGTGFSPSKTTVYMGIDPEQVERIFEIFQRLVPREEYPDVGIGLSICRKNVERHAGRIWAESVPGEGSTPFSLRSRGKRAY